MVRSLPQQNKDGQLAPVISLQVLVEVKFSKFTMLKRLILSTAQKVRRLIEVKVGIKLMVVTLFGTEYVRRARLRSGEVERGRQGNRASDRGMWVVWARSLNHLSFPNTSHPLNAVLPFVLFAPTPSPRMLWRYVYRCGIVDTGCETDLRQVAHRCRAGQNTRHL